MFRYLVRYVLKKDTGEIKLYHKLDPSILTLKGNERQRVGPSTAVFSFEQRQKLFKS